MMLPAFAIPALEKMIGRPIQLVNEEGKPLLNIQEQHVSGEPLIVKFTPAVGSQPGHFYVGHESFSIGELGDNCLIHAVMKGADRKDYTASDVRKEIALSCKDKHHPCYRMIRSGIAHNYLEIGLVGAGRPGWWNVGNPFSVNYGVEVQGRPDLEQWNLYNKEGELTLRNARLDRCHIISWNNIETILTNAIAKENIGDLIRLSRLLPTVDEVDKGNCKIFCDSDGKQIFVDSLKGTKYDDGVNEVRK